MNFANIIKRFAVQGQPGIRGPKGMSGEQGRPGSRVSFSESTEMPLNKELKLVTPEDG